MPADLEARLERALAPRREPGADVEARLRAAVMAALPPARPPARRWLSARLGRRRRIGPLVLVGVLLIGGGALAATLLQWGPSATGRAGAFVSERAARTFAATPALAGAAWLSGPPGAPQRIDEVPPRPSLVFPPGTSYPQALQSFYDAVSRRGELPAGARLGPPLPDGKVVSFPATPTGRVAIDLRAPFGYWVPSGVILPPSYGLGAEIAVYPPAGRPGMPLPVGVEVQVPRLLPCQRIVGGRAGPACVLSARASGRYAPGVVAVPDLAGLRLPDALERVQRERLGLAFDVGYFPALTEGAIERAIARGIMDRQAVGALITLDEFTRLGYGAPDLYRSLGRAGVRLAPSETAPAGAVVAQYPPAGTQVPRGTPVVVAAASDDCLLAPFSGPGWDCVPGSAAARRRVPALRAPLPWLEGLPPGAPNRPGATAPRPSLVFPPGTTYLEALRALLVAVVERGELPRSARLGPPLPAGVVLRMNGDRSLSLELRAPFGYDPATGQISAPTTSPLGGTSARALEAEIRAGRALRLPAVFAARYLVAPALPPCEVSVAGRRPGRCPGSGQAGGGSRP
jgi:PASTA domain-containing protein